VDDSRHLIIQHDSNRIFVVLQADLDQWNFILTFKAQQLANHASLFQGANSTVKQLFSTLKQQSDAYFAYYDKYDYLHYMAYAPVVEVAADVAALVGLATSLNIPGLVLAIADYVITLPLTAEVFSEALPNLVTAQGDSLQSLLDAAESDTLQYIAVYSQSVRKISFDGGIGTYTMSYATSQQQTKESQMTLDRTNKMNLVADDEITVVVGFDSASTVGLNSDSNTERSDTYSLETDSIITIYLGDPNSADSFVVSIFEDNYYGVPMFQLQEGSTTSCPHEPAGSMIEIPYIALLSPSVVTNVPEDSPYGATFVLEISNLSPATSAFVIMPDPVSSGDLRMFLEGSPLAYVVTNAGTIFYLHGNFAPMTLTLTVFPGSSREYNDVILYLYSQFEYGLVNDPTSGFLGPAIKASVSFNVSFTPSFFPVQ